MSVNFAEKLDFCSRYVVFFLFLKERIIIFKKNTIHSKDKYNLKGGNRHEEETGFITEFTDDLLVHRSYGLRRQQ
jgi:hypothetical protein